MYVCVCVCVCVCGEWLPSVHRSDTQRAVLHMCDFTDESIFLLNYILLTTSKKNRGANSFERYCCSIIVVRILGPQCVGGTGATAVVL